MDALREIIVNSFVHANYRAVTENEINMTPTQIEIYNAGEFPMNPKPEMFVESKRKSHPRNKVILNVLYKRKDVEMFGSGFKKAFSSCKERDVKFGYETNEDGFSFVFYRRNDTINIPRIGTLNTLGKLLLKDRKVLESLMENPNRTKVSIASRIGIGTRTVQRCFDRLVDNGYIIRIGSKKSGYWEALKKK